MIRRRLGKSDVLVPTIIIGTWQASGWSASDRNIQMQIYERALELGFNAFDTAPAYGKGRAEEILGELFSGRRDKVVFLSKFSHKEVTARRVRKSLEDSLRRLRTDYIDVFQQHWPCKNAVLAPVVDELLLLKEEGKIRAVGVSNWLEKEFSEIGCIQEIDSLQSCYNLAWRGTEDQLERLCVTNNISLLCSSALCQGVLAGKFEEATELPPDPRRQNWWLQGGRIKELTPLLLAISSFAKKYNCSMSQIALAWLHSRPLVSAMIVGQTDLKQLEANLKSAEIEIGRSDLDQLDELSSALSKAADRESLWGWHSRA